MNRTQQRIALETAYRAAFRDYADKLEILQRLIESGPIGAAQIESILLDAEKARVAHNCARDRLADILGEKALGKEASGKEASGKEASGKEALNKEALNNNGRPLTPALTAGEGHIRETARLMWELAGRPDGTAEHDWCTAEQLVKSVAAPPC